MNSEYETRQRTRKRPFAVLLVIVITATTGTLGELRGIQTRGAPTRSQSAIQRRQDLLRYPPGAAPGTPSAAARNDFGQWIKGGDMAQIKWSTDVDDPTLQMNQTITVRFKATTKVQKLDRLRVDRELVFLFRSDRVDSADGSRPFPDSFTSIPIPKDASSNVEIEFSGVASVLPGDYDFWIAIYDGASKKHSIERRRVHIPQPPDDPLPRLQFQIPPAKLSLPVSNKLPLSVEVISVQPPTFALEILTQIKLADGSISVSVVDLEKQRVIFDQRDVRQLDSTRLWQARSATDSGLTVDIETLQSRSRQAAYFREFIHQRLTSPVPPMRVVILLSGPVSFPRGNDLAPLKLESDCRCRVFHLHFGGHTQSDDIQKILKPLQLRSFEIVTPQELRKALADIVLELERL